MTARARCDGFTLLEVLVALALVASALGGTFMVMREALRTQQYLERRDFAHWVADNVLNQFVLETAHGDAPAPRGSETMLGRRFDYSVSVRTLAMDGGSEPTPESTAEPGLGQQTTPSALPVTEITVDVRDGVGQGEPLARRVARIATGNAGA